MNRIKELREDMDLRQSDVANKTGIDQRSLSNYETGKTNPDSFVIARLAEFFGVSCDYLLGVSDINLKNKADIIQELEIINKRIESILRAIKTDKL